MLLLLVLPLAPLVLIGPAGAQLSPDENGGATCTQELFDAGICPTVGAYFCITAACQGPPGQPEPTTTTPAPDNDPPSVFASASAEGDVVTVTVNSEAGAQFRVELESDDSIIATGVIDFFGTGTASFTLPPGPHNLRVTAFDGAGNASEPTVVTIDVIGPPPAMAAVTVTSGSAEQNLTTLNITGEPGADARIEIVREGVIEENLSGALDGAGVLNQTVLLANGPWGYLVTLSNGVGESEATLGDFTVAIGPPAPPTITVVSDPGSAEVEVAVVGPVGGSAQLTATHSDTRATSDGVTDLSPIDGTGSVMFDAAEDGIWNVEVTATDFQNQSSTPSSLPEGVLVDTIGPLLEVESITADADQFGYRVITEPGTEVDVRSDTEELSQRFTADAEETDFEVGVAAGEHAISVSALDEFGNETVVSLEQTVGGGGGLPVLPIILVVIIGAFGVFGFLKRQDIRDWWYSRQYH